MGALKKFEQRLEGFVNGAFAKVFKSEVQPVEIAGALQRECDNNASIWNRDRTVVPNDFIVELSPHDHERLSPYSGQLGSELAGMVREYAQAQRYSFMGPLKVQLERAEDLDTGLYRVRSRIEAGPEQQAQQQAQAQQGYRPQPPAAPAAPPYGGQQAQAWQPQPGQAPPPPATAPAFPAVNPLGGPGNVGPDGGNVHPFPGAPAQPPAAGGAGGAGPATRRWLEMNGERHQLDRPVVVLGRSTEADVRVDDPGVSRRHAEIRTGNPSMVLDLGSTNGIVVDGQHTGRATLRDGSRIVLGSTTIVYRQAEG
ncbi:putative component of type VI protein secretion system [Streptacidiphilus sp. MAP12-20]|uniref:FhaA domain-containing protein n=1 Tax=Streptacidiphilus sp. MAP12-20 TaxID=3156299 RepID=UPI0035157278